MKTREQPSDLKMLLIDLITLKKMEIQGRIQRRRLDNDGGARRFSLLETHPASYLTLSLCINLTATAPPAPHCWGLYCSPFS